jgi:hypothetical protein
MYFHMKYLQLLFLSLGFLAVLGLYTPVLAQMNLQDAPGQLDAAADDTGIGSRSELGDLSSVIAVALRFILSLLGTLMLGYMVYAGYLWMTAQGDEGAISTAKGIMINTVIGFLVVVSAWAITYLVQSRFQ